jgi:hypothetical protein
MRFLLWFCLLVPAAVTTADKIDEAIANDIFPQTSDLCSADGASTAFSFDFTESTISNWDSENSAYEEDVFQVDMIHSDSNTNRTWTLRIGKGGQISSFITSAGETIANQASKGSAWNDLVQQLVAVNKNRNGVGIYKNFSNFVHGAGPYMKDEGMPPPFYSPKLALDCSGNQCITVNWGQQAHVPTVHRSDLIYYVKYRDCGNGVIELDQIIHHFGNDASDVYNYFNTPWTGIRTSTFSDIMISNTNSVLEHKFPMYIWGTNNAEQIIKLSSTGGFTTFAQDLELSETLAFDLSFNLTVQATNTAKFSSSHTTRYGSYSVKMNLCLLPAPVKVGWRGNGPDGIFFINQRSKFVVHVEAIIHWCWEGTTTYFTSNITDAELNTEFLEGDQILIKYNTAGKSVEDNLAFTFVHGTKVNPGTSRMRIGTTSTPRRDGTVWVSVGLTKAIIFSSFDILLFLIFAIICLIIAFFS